MKIETLYERTGESIFVAIDLQAKLIAAMYDREVLVKNSNALIEASKIFKIPLIFTEQYPKGLGLTDESIAKREDAKVIEKMHFSVFGNDEFAQTIKSMKKKVIVLFGIESHVCVYQSALDALNEGYEVYLASDGTSSRKIESKLIALGRMEKIGVNVETTEMILFQYLNKAGGDDFKKISSLIK